MSTPAREAAATRPALVLLPGTLCDDTLWEPMLGLRPALRARASARSYASARSAREAAHALLPHLPARFAVLGFSLGGFVALELAHAAPGRVAGLALVATNARADITGNAARRRAAVAAARERGLGNYVREQLWPQYVAPSRLHDDALAAPVIAMAERAGFDTFEAQTEIAISRADSLTRLAAMRMPSLIVSGRHDVINPADRQQELHAGLPGSVWRVCETAGHFVPLEAPAELADFVETWLARVDAAVARI
ncbi:alpha/beta fold hydrolase [Burkholderia cenocepacia]|uniref:alpha/beta fold hydrolase n=1 Tax=Burkholderia cenocepacia TaxID=95486 RepID=UPI00286315D4|nr:alpha/beta hydrolase [Burkholderia cenocepacia]MDR5646535.1 alpha/beta hydrolase [Burkholderia cenocepacia]